MGHPCPRRYNHVNWLVNNYSSGVILDPFAGSGVTLAAAKNSGFKAIGIEIEEKYCDIAVQRLRQRVFNFKEEEDL